MAGDGGVLRIGQAELRQAGARAAGRAYRGFHLREEAVEYGRGDVFAGQLGAYRAADQLRAAAGHDDRLCRGVRIAQQDFLGRATGIGQGAQLPCVEPGVLGSQFSGHDMGQCQVHVVAAKQDVIPHGDPVQFQIAVAFDHRDQRKIAGAAADIDHQDDVARFGLLAPAACAGLYPVVQRRLRFFEQGQRLEAGRPGGFGRQFARRRIERGGNGDRHILLVEWRFGLGMIPGRAQMGQIAHRSFERRYARHVLRRVAGQYRCPAVHAGMAQPALGTRYQAYRRRRAATARQLADGVRLLVAPWQAQVARRPVPRHGAGRETTAAAAVPRPRPVP